MCCYIYLVYIMELKSSESSLAMERMELDSNLRLYVKNIVIWRISAKIHFIVYLAINILLCTINQMSDPAYQWWLWAATGWGIPLAIHLFFAINQKKVSGFQWHLFIYLYSYQYLFNVY